MTENRYYKKDWEEAYYIFDSNTITEDEFEKRVEYEGYDVFVDSLTGSEIIGLLNENDELKQKLSQLAKVNREGVQKVQSLAKEKEQLKKEINKYIVVNNGLNTEYECLKEENEQLKSICQDHKDHAMDFKADCGRLEKENDELKKENNNLKKALWEAEENYLYEAYYDNSARREDKLQNLKEDFKREYWND